MNKFNLEYVPFPKELLHIGLCVQLEHEINGELVQGWATILKHEEENVLGVWDRGFPEIEGQEIKFECKDIIVSRGTMEWNIEHLTVLCSIEVCDGVPVGYFYNGFTDRPLHYGRSFYSINEVEDNKCDLDLFELPLKELLMFNRNVEPYLSELGYCGFVRNAEDGFDELQEEDIVDKDSDVFLCMYELDRVLPASSH